MLNNLRRKFVLYAMLVTIIVSTALVGSINLSYVTKITADADTKLQFIADNEGAILVPSDEEEQREVNITPETKFATRYFTVKLDANNNPGDVNLENTVLSDYQEAVEYARHALSRHRSKGTIDNLRYLITEKDYGKIIVFMDFTTQRRELSTLMYYSFSVSILALTAVFLMLFAISSRVVMPVVNSIEKQKQFITNAGHELKTPLAIISANTEVLEMMYDKNEWLESIKNQTKRLDLLIKSMLKLSKMEESSIKTEFTSFDMADVVKKTAEGFRTAATDRTFTVNADEPVQITADKDCVAQLTSILLDNAIKYTKKGESITVCVKKNQKNAELSVSNSGVDMSPEEASRLFERFYRSDSSRARTTGGYGIGLSIAKSIMDSHGGKIFAVCENNVITFKAIFS